jgi:hypothetical protein
VRYPLGRANEALADLRKGSIFQVRVSLSSPRLNTT